MANFTLVDLPMTAEEKLRAELRRGNELLEALYAENERLRAALVNIRDNSGGWTRDAANDALEAKAG